MWEEEILIEQFLLSDWLKDITCNIFVKLTAVGGFKKISGVVHRQVGQGCIEQKLLCQLVCLFCMVVLSTVLFKFSGWSIPALFRKCCNQQIKKRWWICKKVRRKRKCLRWMRKGYKEYRVLIKIFKNNKNLNKQIKNKK